MIYGAPALCRAIADGGCRRSVRSIWPPVRILLRDRPVAETKDIYLCGQTTKQKSISLVSSTLRVPSFLFFLDDQLLPTTVGVYGDWGSGKSSLLRMVEKRLRAEEGTLVLWFNGWLFESFEDAKTALMERS